MNTPISPSRPIAVDLDGTLIKGDMMMEAAVAMITKNPLFVFCLPLWLLRGRAFMKEKIARYAPPLPGAHLPYRHNLLAWLREQKRPLVLATAAHKTHAEAVAKHLGIFSAVLATENGVNLSGKNKAQQLCKLYGEHNFDYAGNSRADIAVWQHAANAIVVAAPRSVRNNIGIPVLHSITDDGIIAKLRHWRRAIRPRHWLKNLLLFVAVVGGHQLFSPPVLGASVLAFAVFCLMASAAYLLNDIFDLQHDRTNENKKRPAAAGDIGIAESFGAAILLYAAAAYLAFYLPPPFVYIAGFYGAATLIYSLWLKRALCCFWMRAFYRTAAFRVSRMGTLFGCADLIVYRRALSLGGGFDRGTAARGIFRIVFVGDSVVYDVKRRHHSCNPPNGKILPPPLANGKLIKMDSRSCGNDKKMRAHCLFYAESHSIDKSNAPHIKLGRSRNT